MRRMIPLSILLALACTGFKSPAATQFSHRYEIRASSSSMADQMMLYTYKTYLIDTYEDLCFSLPESLHDQAVRENIESFSLLGKAKTELKYGTLVMSVGLGVGPSIHGDLRKSACDEGPIDTRFFFFDFFSR